MSENREQFVLEDGRKAEKVVTESRVNEKETQRVIEIKAEEQRPLKTQQRITEKTRSYVYERVIETIDQETGSVVDTKVEKLDCVTGDTLETLKTASTQQGRGKLNSLGALEEVENAVLDQKNGYDVKDIVLTIVIIAQVLGLLYLILSK